MKLQNPICFFVDLAGMLERRRRGKRNRRGHRLGRWLAYHQSTKPGFVKGGAL